MINVEGVYEDIIAYLNVHRVGGVEYSESHGILYTLEEDNELGIGRRLRINFGLFSICEDYHSETAFSPQAADMSFDPVKIKEALNDWDHMLKGFRV